MAREELRERLRQGEVTVLDVRPEDEFALGHSARRGQRPAAEARACAWPTGRTAEIVAYCRGPYCVLSFEAVAKLRARGFTTHGWRTATPNGRRRGSPSR